MVDNTRRLPIKVVLPQDEDFSPPKPGGAPPKIFGAIDPGVRGELTSQIDSVRKYFRSVKWNSQRIPAVARVVLKKEALAKTYRPSHLFGDATCPIIGGEGFGRLLVSVSPSGLSRLEKELRTNNSKVALADISTIERIEPYRMEDAVGAIGVDGLELELGKHASKGLKLRLFRHRDPVASGIVQTEFLDLLRSLDLPSPEPLDYGPSLAVFRVHSVSHETLTAIARFVGTQSLGIFPQYRLFAQYIPLGTASDDDFPSPEPGRRYPVVGIIDSGTDPANSLLQAWVIDRDEEDVPLVDQDNNHGSFVAGLIVNGHGLNHQDARFPLSQAKIVDVVAMPGSDSPIYEDDLLRTIQRAVRKYSEIKVWNLSVSSEGEVCRDDGFSEFGIAIDKLQRDYDVTFVTCAGNYHGLPLRRWPPSENLGNSDRLYPPADSALGITVGSVAHRDHESSLVRREDPSPFSRRGPGAAFLPKPEVCHYGGNCDSSLNCRQIGILSLDGSGNISEAIGTSFSTPLISSLLASVREGGADPMSRNLAKALLIHSAALKSGPISAESLKYKGFGVPAESYEILTCAPWQATLIFEPKLQRVRRLFAKEEFPIPQCFRNADGKIYGEILLTLVYDPPLDPTAGAEYCQANVDVSLGTYDPGKDGKIVHKGKIPLEPRDYNKLYERYLVEHGFKWSPVKVYRKRLSGMSGDRWRLFLQLFYRANMVSLPPQNVALVATLFDPEQQRPVYNDVVTAMAVSGWITQDLRIDERIRLRG